MFEQSSTGRTYTRDAYAPVRPDAHAQVEELTGASLPAPFHFSNFEKSVLDRSFSRPTVVMSAVLLNNRPIGVIELKVARQLISCRFAVEATVGAALLDRETFDCHAAYVCSAFLGPLCLCSGT